MSHLLFSIKSHLTILCSCNISLNFPDWYSSAVSDPPPILFPLMKTFGTVLLPVILCRASWKKIVAWLKLCLHWTNRPWYWHEVTHVLFWRCAFIYVILQHTVNTVSLVLLTLFYIMLQNQSHCFGVDKNDFSTFAFLRVVSHSKKFRNKGC